MRFALCLIVLFVSACTNTVCAGKVQLTPCVQVTTIFLVLIILPVRATRIHDPAVTFPEKINILSLTQTKHNKLANTRVVHIYVYTGTLLRGESSV